MNKKNLLKTILTMVIVLGVVMTVYAGMGKSQVSKGQYVRREIFLGKWGTEKGELGYKEPFVDKFGHSEAISKMPTKIAVDINGNIYVADKLNHRIQKFSPEGKFLMKIGGKEDPNKYFENIWDIAVDLRGNIYISNKGQKRVLKFNAQGQFIQKLLFTKEFPSWAEGPWLMIDAQNNLYMDFGGPQWIYKYDGQGNFLGKSKPRISDIRDTDSKGNYYTRDFDKNEIQKYDSQDNLIARIKWEPDTVMLLTVDRKGNIYLTLAEVPGVVDEVNPKGFYIIKYELVK